MCAGPLAKPKAPSMPPPPPPPPPPPTEASRANPEVKKARRQAQTRQRALAGDRSTMATGARGLLAGEQEQTGRTTLGGY